MTGTRGFVEFDCAYKTVDILTVGKVYRCSPRVKFVGESRHLGRVLGVHQLGKTHKDVDYLEIFNQHLPFIPNNLSFFKNLKGLEFYNSNLTTISAGDLQPFPQLLLFLANNNRLVSIDGDLFKHTPLLRWISFSYNQIHHVGHDLVKNLNHLESLWFNNNPCVDLFSLNGKRDDILRINDRLPIFCPLFEMSTEMMETATTTSPTTTTESPQECPCACLERIESIELKTSEHSLQIDEQKFFNAEQDERIGHQDGKLSELNFKVSDQIEMIADLNDKNADLKAAVTRQNGQIRELAERLIELERIVKEITSTP